MTASYEPLLGADSRASADAHARQVGRAPRTARVPVTTSPLTPARTAGGWVPRQPLAGTWSADTRWPDSIHWPTAPLPAAPPRPSAASPTRPVPHSPLAMPSQERGRPGAAHQVRSGPGAGMRSWLGGRRAAFAPTRAVAGAVAVGSAAAVPVLAPGASLRPLAAQVAAQAPLLGVAALAVASLLGLAVLGVAAASVRERGAANVVPSLLRTVVAVSLGAAIVAVGAPTGLAVLPMLAAATALVALSRSAAGKVTAAVGGLAALAIVHAEALVSDDVPLAAALAAVGVVLGLRLVVSALSQPAPAREVAPPAPTSALWAPTPGSADLTAFLPQREYVHPGDVWRDAR